MLNKTISFIKKFQRVIGIFLLVIYVFTNTFGFALCSSHHPDSATEIKETIDHVHTDKTAQQSSSDCCQQNENYKVSANFSVSQKIFFKQVVGYNLRESATYFIENQYLQKTPDYYDLKVLQKSTIQSDIMIMNM